jgi:hypothetical protein
MATFNQRDIQTLFVGGAIGAADQTTSISNMQDNEIGIFTPAGTRITEATALTEDKFIIVKKTANGGIPLVSGVINKNDIKNAIRKEYVAATDQVTEIGYNGTTGAIDAQNDTDYHIRISVRDARTSNHGGLYLKHAFYTSDASATEFEIASELLKSLNNNFSKEPEEILTATMLCNDAGTNTTATTGTLTTVKGSKYVTVSGNTTEFQVGGLLRLGTATTDEVYEIVALDTTVMTLDTAVTSAGAAYTATNANAVTAAGATAGTFGLILTGVAPNHVVGKLHADLQPNIFDVTLENFGTTGNVTSTAATAGNGTQKQVAELEWFCQGNEGDFHRIGEPNLFPTRSEVSGNYDLIDLIVEETYTGSIVNGPIRKVFTLAIPETAPNYAITATGDDITDVLEVLAFGSATGDLAVS